MSHRHKVEQQGFHVPRTLTELRHYLQAAMEVEHLTIPVYMTGMYTIRPGTNAEAYYTIRSVLLEEMLHMTLVANLLNAVGGEPRVAHPEFLTSYPAKLPLSSDTFHKIGLRHFSKEAFTTFLEIERPKASAPAAAPGSGWTSIGQFYETVEKGLRQLVKDQGGTKVFSGPASRQVGPQDFYNSGGEVFEVKDLGTALKALETISEQGEGVPDSIWDSDDKLFDEEAQPAHYFRFNEILQGRRYTHRDKPKSQPSGPPVNVSWDEADVYPIWGESRIADYLKFQHTSAVYDRALAFNRSYATLLSFLECAFNGWPALMMAAVPTMLELRDRAEQLYRNPHPDPEYAGKGYHASATFEISSQQFAHAKEKVAAFSGAAVLEPGKPVDLSGITAESGEQFA